ncbi:MAG: O-methyltransferase [Betaproteobacteria bacterium]
MSADPLRFCDKLLSDQHEHSYYFRDGADYASALYATICRASGITSPMEELKLEQTDKFTVEEMASNPVSLRFLQFLMRVAGVKRVLEIGAFIGVSAMYFAKALPPGGEVVTIEKFDHFAAIARRNFAANGLDDRIKLIDGDAFEIIEKLPKGELFDMIFIDGNKERYKDYFVKTEPLLSPNGIALVDDCFFHGDAVNTEPTNDKGRGVRAFLDYAATRDDYLRIALPLANGIMMMVRRAG